RVQLEPGPHDPLHHHDHRARPGRDPLQAGPRQATRGSRRPGPGLTRDHHQQGASRTMTPRIIIDCDPGHDDAMAIILAAGDPRVELLAITTVAGNQTVEKVTANALAVCAVAGIDVPVAQGAAEPLVRPQVVAEDIHGDSGLDGPELPRADRELDPRHAVDLIIDEVMAAEPGTITLVPTGPLTNIALAMKKEPRIVERVKEVVL